MNDPNESLDQSIEKILAWRASRAAPVGLLDQISAGIGADVRQRGRGRGFFGGTGRMGRLALMGAVLAALLAAAIGAWGVGSSRPQVVAPSTSPAVQSAAATPASLAYLYCTDVRPVPFDASKIDLTGTWSDRSELLYLHQEGNVVWGVGIDVLGEPDAFDPSSAFFQPMHGTIGAGLTVHLDRGDVGVVNATETRTPPLGNGTIDLHVERGSDGNVQLTTTAQTGADELAGPAFGNPVFTPCTPAVR